MSLIFPLIPSLNLADVVNAATARSNLGLAIGSNVQAYNANTTVLGNTTTGTGSIVLATSPTFVTPVLGAASATSLACPTFTSAAAMGFTPASGSGFSVTLAGAGDFAVNTNQLCVDTSLGNVGIGTSSPGSKLEVSTTTGTNGIAITNSSVSNRGFIFYPVTNGSNTDVRFYESSLTSGDRVTFQAGGNVGIGTTSPSAKLHAISTTEQLRLGYDASNYYSTTVSSAGSVNFAATGASAAFAFNATVTASGGFITGNIILYSSTVSVPTATNVTINVRANTSTMATGYCYRVRLNTAGTGTVTGAVYIINQTSITPTWVATAVSVAGSTTNHPLLIVSGSNIQVYHNHGSTYLVSYVVETIAHNNGTANAATIWGADSLFTGTDSTSITTASGYALGVGTSPSAKIHGISTTEQLRLGYDASNYYSTTVSSAGAVTFDAVGASSGFTFSDAVTVSVATPLVTFKPTANNQDCGLKVLDSVGAIAGYLSIVPNTIGTNSKFFMYLGGAAAADIKMTVDDDGVTNIKRDASNYCTITPSSVGLITFDAVGSAAAFTFADNVSVTNTAGDCIVTATGGTPSTTAGDGYLLLTSSRTDTGVGHVCKLRSVAPSAGKADLAFLTQPSNGVYTERMRIDNAGNVGIGMTPTYLVDILSPTLTNFGTQWFMRARGPSSCTTNGTNYMLAFDMDVSNMSVSAGVTDSGYRMGVRGDAYSSVAGFAGTLATQYGVYGRAGINVATAGAAVTNAEGLHGEVLNSVAGTTITNGFGLKVVNTGTTGTMTNRWGVYVDTATGGKNYFSHAVGVGSTTISAQIHATSTTEQLRLGYDASNYYSTTVSSGGAVTFDAVGASARFTFSDPVTAQSSLTLGVASTTTGSLVLCGSGGANTHTIKAAAIPAATNSYVWPSASPTASQVLTASAPATGVVTLSWSTSSVGDVVGPASSTANAASVFSGTTGKLLRASPTVTYYSVAAGVEDKIEFGATFKDFRTATDGATVTFDLDLSDQWQVTFAGNRTLAVSNASIGQVITILRYQDATGNRTPTWWSNITWNNGLAPVDDPTASGWSMTVLACEGLDAYSVPKWKEVCRSTSAPLRGITTATDGATVTFDLRVCQTQRVTLAGNRTLALTSGSFYVGQMFDIKLTQDATGSRTVTWFSAVKWTGGTIPTLTTTAGRSDWFRFICTNASGSPTFDCLGTSMNLVA